MNYGFGGNNPYAANQPARLIKAIFLEQPLHAEQYYRPYTPTHEDVSSMYENVLYEAFENGSAANLDAAAVGAWGILRPSDVVSGTYKILGEQGNRRFSVHMLFEIVTNGFKRMEVISGYTNYVGVSHTENIDPEMLLTVNSVTVIDNNGIGRNGTQWKTSAHGLVTPMSSNIVMENGLVEKPVGMLAASDLCLHGQLFRENEALAFNLNNNNFATNTDLTSHGLVSSMVRGLISARNSDISLGDDDAALTTASSRLSCFSSGYSSMSGKPSLSQTVYNGIFRKDNVVKMGTILSNWPQQHHDYHFNFLSNAIMDYRNVANDLGGSTIEYVLAHIISSMCPSIITAAGLCSLAFVVTNETMDGLPSSSIIDGSTSSLLPVPISPNTMNETLRRLTVEIDRLMRSQSVGNYNVSIDVNALDTCFIELSLSGEPFVPFACPAYCSAMVSANPFVNTAQPRIISNTIMPAVIDAATTRNFSFS